MSPTGAAVTRAASAEVIVPARTIAERTYARRSSAADRSPSIGSYRSGAWTRPASSVACAAVSRPGVVEKYTRAAAATP